MSAVGRATLRMVRRTVSFTCWSLVSIFLLVNKCHFNVLIARILERV